MCSIAVCAAIGKYGVGNTHTVLFLLFTGSRLVTAVVYLLVSRSLNMNGFICHAVQRSGFIKLIFSTCLKH
jgi:hypothetical protein